MARKPRIHYPGALYHVMLRGNAKQTIFTEAAEYQQFEKIVAEGLEAHQVRLHAYCWMSRNGGVRLRFLWLLSGKIPRRWQENQEFTIRVCSTIGNHHEQESLQISGPFHVGITALVQGHFMLDKTVT